MPVWGSADRLHAHRVLVFVFHEHDFAHGNHIDASRPAVALECPGSRGGLKFAQRTRPFARSISHLPLPHSHSPPSPTHIFFFLMSFNEDQIVTDLVYELLNDTVTLNLSTGLAYGTPPSPLPSLSLPFRLFLPLTAPDRSSRFVFRNVPCRVLHLSQDTSVRARSFPFPIGPSLARTLKLSLLARAAPRGPCPILLDPCSCLGSRRSSLYSPLPLWSSAPG
jgi:hypothetical protein